MDVDDPFDRFQTPSPTFELGVLDWTSARSEAVPPAPHVQILLCTRGQFTIQGAEDQVTLPSGGSLLVGANWGPFQIQGQGQLFRATVPEAKRSD